MAGDGTLGQPKKEELSEEQKKEIEKIKLLNGLITPSRVPTDFPESFDLVVVNMAQLLFEGKAKSVIVPVKEYNLAILPGHTPLFTRINKGTIVINKPDNSSQEINVENGIARIAQLKVVILIGFSE